jgi:hypothetical protein
MRNHQRIAQLALSGLAVLSLFAVTLATPRAQVHAASAGATRTISAAGTTSPQTGDFVPSDASDVTQAEFPGQEDDAAGPAPYPGTIVDRSLSSGTGNGNSVQSGQKAKSNPSFVSGFEGLNLYQQRYARGGNQFTVEPPDQGLCAGNGYVVEAVNDVFNAYNTAGQSVLPDNTATNIVSGLPRNVNHAIDLNSFYWLRPRDQPQDGCARAVRDRSDLPV